ncbi:MBL fold metallo-hydrolase [Clostridium sp.]|uniref:MBL fold metallo-hydrolase n=1 Tax=Clostridium sp. TaxID=1506 RepID=UPI002848F3BE|nr:MBL fold metallo-hydrolase [Clostridium sp.]MDR3595046.1 MBL fold metallo-hydrolase [Clostridium sp.]
MVNLKIFPAGYGDCFLIGIHNLNKSFNILVDGGLSDTYKNSLKKELKKLSKTGQKIDLLINTHIDSDHINGLISFLRDNNKSKYIEIDEIWYNGLEQIAEAYTMSEKTIDNDIKIIDKICEKGYEDEFKEIEDASAIGGISFSSLIEFGKYNHNKVVDGKAITNKLKKIKFSEHVKIKIISPNMEELRILEEEWAEELAKENYKFTVPKCMKLVSTFEFLVSRLKNHYEKYRKNVSGSDELESYVSDLQEVDNSIVNGSSISFVLEIDEKKLLFLGDSIVKIKDKCMITKKLIEEYGENAKFNLIKLPHHGSRYNMTNDFLTTFRSDDYVISSNSEKFGHPDIDVLANLICRNQQKKTLIFNYPVRQYEILNNEAWMAHYRYNVLVGDGINYVERRY